MNARYVKAYHIGKLSSQELVDNIISHLLSAFDNGMREFPPEAFESVPRELEETFQKKLRSDPEYFAISFVCNRNDPADYSAAKRRVTDGLDCLRLEFAKRSG